MALVYIYGEYGADRTGITIQVAGVAPVGADVMLTIDDAQFPKTEGKRGVIQMLEWIKSKVADHNWPINNKQAADPEA